MAKILGIDSLIKKMYYLATIADPSELNDVASNMERSAKQMAPTKTGNMKNSIKANASTTGSRTTIKLYAGVNYAVYVEKGTSKMPARPFLKPAFNKHKDEVRRNIKSKIRKVTK